MGAPGVCGLGASLPFKGVTLSTKDEVHSLGVLLDPALSVASQVASVVHSSYFHLKRVAQLRRYLDTRSLTTLVYALVVLRLDYFNSLYMAALHWLPVHFCTSFKVMVLT